MKKITIVLLMLIAFVSNSQTKIKYKQMENPGTSSINLGPNSVTSPTIYGGSTAASTLNLIGSSSATSGIVSIGSGTASGFISNGTSTLTGSVETKTIQNSAGSLVLNASTGNLIALKVNNNNIMQVASTGVTMTGTLALGSGVLSGGNTGTVAVLSDALFSINFMSTATNLGDGVTYYFGNVPYLLTAAQTSLGAVKVPYNCTLVGYSYGSLYTPGTAENATLAINGTTNYTLSSTITFSTAGNSDTKYVTGLSQDFNSGDIMNGKLVCPSYATNPSFVHTGLTLWFVRRP